MFIKAVPQDIVGLQYGGLYMISSLRVPTSATVICWQMRCARYVEMTQTIWSMFFVGVLLLLKHGIS